MSQNISIYACENSKDFPWLSGKKWEISPRNERIEAAMAQQYGVSPVIAALLVQRGVAVEDVESYLNPTLRELMQDPFQLLDMHKAVDRLCRAIEAKEVIGIFGDYDVDGATSSALLVRYFRDIGIETAVYIPDRQKEGYGPNITGFRELQRQGASLIITVDTGTLAFDVLQQAAEEGMQTIVLDHHQGEPTLPQAIAVVNPNRFDERSDYTNLAAVGVVFLLLVALTKQLREQPLPSQPELASNLPDLRWLLDIVALGTVADVVPLTGLNRAFVVQGLRILAQRRNAGLVALMDIARLDEAPNPYHLGFVLGPRINAGGRVGQSDLGVRLLTTQDSQEAKELAALLDSYNQERRAIESGVVEAAKEQATRQQGAFLIAQGEGWHEGVIGIAAGRLKEQFNQPAAVISWNEQGVGKASARSVKGVDLGQAIIAARQQGLLEAGGGHAMAAGFTVTKQKFDEFANFMHQRLESAVHHYQHDYSHRVDIALPLSAATVPLIQSLEQLGPFGAGNAAPRYVFEGVTLVAVDVLKDIHLRCIFAEDKGKLAATNGRLKAMLFSAVDTQMGQLLLNSVGRQFDVIARLKRESWQGRESVTAMLDDIRRR